MRQWISPHNKDSIVFVTDGKIISCLLCAKDVVCKQRSHVESSCASGKSAKNNWFRRGGGIGVRRRIFIWNLFLFLASHVAAVHRAVRSKLKQPTLPALSSSTMMAQTTFARDMCEVFLAANIPLHKLSNEKVRNFLEKYTTHRVPSESTIRKTQVSALFELRLHQRWRNDGRARKLCRQSSNWKFDDSRGRSAFLDSVRRVRENKCCYGVHLC